MLTVPQVVLQRNKTSKLHEFRFPSLVTITTIVIIHPHWISYLQGSHFWLRSIFIGQPFLMVISFIISTSVVDYLLLKYIK